MVDGSPSGDSSELEPVYWPRVKEILDGIMARWIERAGRNPLPGIHDFYWETSQDLKDGVSPESLLPWAVRYEVVADDKDVIAGRLSEWADSGEVDLIVTTGGTGLGRHDITPEACLSVIDKEVPGLAETMRAETLKFTPMAMLSRSVAGIRGHTLIITLPGSTKGVQECLEVVLPVLPHALELLQRESVSDHPR